MFFTEAAATESEVGLLPETVELILCAHVSLRVSGATEYQSSWKPRVSSGNKMLLDGGPHWLSRPAERLLMVREPACATAKPSLMVHIAWPPGTGIICSKLLSFLSLMRLEIGRIRYVRGAVSRSSETCLGPGVSERRKNEVHLMWVLIVTSCLQQRSQYPNSSIRTPETH